MSKQRTKNTKRFTFIGKRNETSHKSGANTVTISTRDYDTNNKRYSSGTTTATTMTMTVKEAGALSRFLNEFLDRE